MSAIDEFLILFKTQVHDGGLNRLNSKIKSTRHELFSVKNLLRGFIGYDIYSAVKSFIPQMIQTSRDLGAMHARFFAVTNDAKLANEEFDWLTAQTQRLGLELMKTADNYSIFFATAKSSLGVGTTREIYSQMLEAIRVLHITPEKMSQIFYAFREIASEGTLKLQRLTRQLGTSIPDAMNIAAKSMGYATDKAGIEKFRDAISNAEIDSKTFLINFSRGVSKQFVSTDKLAFAMHQVDAQLQILQNSWQLFMVKMSQSGFSDDLIKVLEGVNKGMSFMEKHAHGIYKILKKIGQVALIWAVGGTIFGMIKFLSSASTIASIFKMAKGLEQIVAALNLIILSGEYSTGATLAGGIMAFIANPWVWVPLAIAAIGVVFAIVIKKYFPNVYNNIMAFWLELRLSIGDFVRWLNETPVFKLLRRLADGLNISGTNIGTDIRNAQNERLRKNPNYIFPSKVLGFDDVIKERVFSMFPQYRFGKALNTLGRASLSNIMSIQKIDNSVHIDGSGIDSSQDLIDKIKEAQTESHNKVLKTLQIAISGSKAFSLNPLSLSGVISP